jgi:MFS family permease
VDSVGEEMVRTDMNRDDVHFLFLNVGHFLDHLFTLIFATVAALVLVREWDVGYGDLLRYATPGFFALGLFSYPAGWLADRWSQEGMIVVYFIGAGIASITTALAGSALQIGIGLFVIGIFAAIYHPVGLAIVTRKWRNIGMRVAVNNVWGNLGVASAALITGFLIDSSGWRMAFILPGIASILIGLVYLTFEWSTILAKEHAMGPDLTGPASAPAPSADRRLMWRVSTIVFLTTALSNLIFQATTFSLPKIFDERLQGLTAALVEWLGTIGLRGQVDLATTLGILAFTVFAIASSAQVIVGALLDRFEARSIYIGAAILQVVFFVVMIGSVDMLALVAALGFMLGVFGQAPINDVVIAKVSTGTNRARLFGARYVVAFTAIATALPLVSLIYERWGFGMLFWVLTVTAVMMLALVVCLPRRLSASH